MHELNRGSWHVLCIHHVKIFLHFNFLPPYKLAFQNVPDLAFVKARIHSSTITSHYATSHVSSGFVSVRISILLTMQSHTLGSFPGLDLQLEAFGLHAIDATATWLDLVWLVRYGTFTVILEKYDLSYS